MPFYNPWSSTFYQQYGYRATTLCVGWQKSPHNAELQKVRKHLSFHLDKGRPTLTSFHREHGSYRPDLIDNRTMSLTEQHQRRRTLPAIRFCLHLAQAISQLDTKLLHLYHCLLQSRMFFGSRKILCSSPHDLVSSFQHVQQFFPFDCAGKHSHYAGSEDGRPHQQLAHHLHFCQARASVSTSTSHSINRVDFAIDTTGTRR